MTDYTHKFYVERNIGGEDVEFYLQVNLDITSSNKYTDNINIQIDGPVFVIDLDDNISRWDGLLTEEEIEMIEDEVRETYSDKSPGNDDDEDLIVYSEYDDYDDLQNFNTRRMFY
jgi:hypothetical protein